MLQKYRSHYCRNLHKIETQRRARFSRTEQYSGTTFDRSRSVSRSSKMLLCLLVTSTRNMPCIHTAAIPLSDSHS